MTSNSKVGLGYEIQSNNEVLSYEEEMNRTVFKCTEEDFLNKPLYSRFSKTDNFKGVPHPLTGDYTPKPQEEIDDSLYVYGKKGPQKPEISDSDDNSTEHSTCQSNDSEGSFGNPSEHSSESESESISVPNEMSTSKSVTTNEKVVSESKEVEPSCATHVKTPRQPMKNQGTPKVKGKSWNKILERELGGGYSFIKKKCFVCGSLSHLIRDCDFNEKKMAREAEFKKKRVFNTGNGVAKPVWNNENMVNRANHFVPRPVQLNAVRSNVNTVRANVNFVRQNVNTGRANVNSGRANVNSVRSNVNTVRPKQPVPTSNSNSFSPGNWGTAVKTSAGYNWRNTRPNSNCNSGSNFVRTDHPLKNMEDRGIFDSGCSAHMTGNKDHLDDFEECKGGYHTFEQPSSEHQPLSPRQETEIPLSQDSMHLHVAEEKPITVDDLLQLVPKLITKVDSLEKELKQTKLTMGKAIVKLVKKVKKMEVVLKRRHVVLTDSEDEDAENSSKQGRNLQEEWEADISPEGLEAAETLAKVLTQRTKTYTRKVKTGLRRKLDADEVSTGEGINTGFTEVNTAFEEINSGDESIIPSPKKGQREGKAVLEEKSQSNSLSKDGSKRRKGSA
ncbi:ribonuclease H-like domain-containing protein [Tanacetum coccineum]